MLDVRRMMLLRELKLRGSISAAARALSYSHSAVSQQLSLLEREAGVPLLEKVGRGVRLTGAAEDLVRHADQVLAILETAESDLAATDPRVRGTLRLAAFTSISRVVVPQVFRMLQTEHPDLDLRYTQVEPETGLLLLSLRRIDVLVVDSYPGTSGLISADLVADRLAQDPIRAYLPWRGSAATKNNLSDVPWVFEPRGTEAHAWAQSLCRQHGFEPDVAYESADLLFHLRMVEAGVAAAFLPDLLMRDADMTLVPTRLIDSHRVREISLVCRAGSEHRPTIRACQNAFAAAL